ncbi:hypothetical protein GCM10028857_24060 [Salinarchaeum chitinilyticum]
MRTKIAALVALGAGVLTVRTIRKRRAEDEAPDPRTEARAEANEATDHATAALSHARTAGGHAVEYARGEIENADVPAPRETEQTSPRLLQRLR